MLLRSILQTLDAELDRLHKLRAILAPLGQPVLSLTSIAPTQELIPVPIPEPTLTRLRPKREPVRRARKPKVFLPLPRALTANVPHGPLVIPPATRQPAPPPEIAPISTPAPSPGSFAAMVRAAERDLAS